MTVPFALSIHNFVNSVGAYVGFGSIVAVALLVLLYFAHARETATLRDRLDEAQQRISGLEGRIAQLMQAQSAARRVPGPVPPPVVPTPAPVRPGVAPAPAARRMPSPATAAAVATAAPAAGMAAAASSRGAAASTWAPAGTAAPALASATKLIPDPAGVGSGAPDDTIFIPPAAVTNGQGAATHAQAVSAATQAMPVAAASARTPSASPRGAVAAPPRVQVGSDVSDAATAAGASGGGNRIRRIGGNRQPAAPILPSFDEDAGGGRLRGRVLPFLVGGIALVVIVAGLLVITNTGGGSNTGRVANTTTNQTGAGLHKQKTKPVAFDPSHVTVAVLNGTAQSGLAGDIGTKLVGDGYKKGNITNAASQTEALTFVYYRGAANKVAAQHVAKALTLSPSRVHRAGSRVLQACAISASGASLGSCPANVIVSAGQDRVSLASGG
jgi:hypothetical protein